MYIYVLCLILSSKLRVAAKRYKNVNKKQLDEFVSMCSLLQEGAGTWRLSAELSACLYVYLITVVCASQLLCLLLL